MKKRNLIILIVVIVFILLVAAGGAYWYFFMQAPAVTQTGTGGTSQSGFQPFGRTTPFGSGSNTAGTSTSAGNQNYNSWTPGTPFKLPTLRLLSDTPIGGYGASTTASTTVVRWVDRGRGNVYEATYDSPLITTISNTVVPRMYESAWNKNLTAFIGSLLPDNNRTPTNVYAQIIIHTTSAGASAGSASGNASVTPFELRGKNLPAGIIGYAVSPDKSKLFTLINQNGSGVGYVSTFDGQKMVAIFTTPLIQVNVDWPTDNAIVIITKGSSVYDGFMYIVNPKTGVWKRAVGPLPGLGAKVSRDGKYAIVSWADGNNGISTGIYSMASGTSTNAVIHTLADKCAWGNFYKDMAYCAVPSQTVAGAYPEDWYAGTLSTVDKIWQMNAMTGEVRLISSIIDQSDRVIDASNLGLDAKDGYLFFMNKNDLSFWSLDLVQSQ
jgi:hypothetical protein